MNATHAAGRKCTAAAVGGRDAGRKGRGRKKLGGRGKESDGKGRVVNGEGGRNFEDCKE